MTENKTYILNRDYTDEELESMSYEELTTLFEEVDKAMVVAKARITKLKEQSDNGYIDEKIYSSTKSFLSFHQFAKYKIAQVRKAKKKEHGQKIYQEKKQRSSSFFFHFHAIAKTFIDEKTYNLISERADELKNQELERLKEQYDKRIKIYAQNELILDLRLIGDDDLVQKFIDEQAQWLNSDVRCYIKSKLLKETK